MNKPLELSDLTEEQHAYWMHYGYNGCGSRVFTKVPDFIFAPAALAHDWKYFIGCTEKDRNDADSEFFHIMMDQVRKQPWYKQVQYRILANIYSKAVKLLGKYSFEYADSPASTWEEVKFRIDRANSQDSFFNKFKRQFSRKLLTKSYNLYNITA